MDGGVEELVDDARQVVVPEGAAAEQREDSTARAEGDHRALRHKVPCGSWQAHVDTALSSYLDLFSAQRWRVQQHWGSY